MSTYDWLVWSLVTVAVLNVCYPILRRVVRKLTGH